MKRNSEITDSTKNDTLRWMDTHISSDVFGSYTGVPAEENEIPVQDADDL